MKTIEDKAIEYCSETEENGYKFVLRSPFKSFKAGVEFAQQWIKIDDELPNNNEIVITIRKRLNGKTYYHLNSIKDGKWNIAIPDTSDVTHWRFIDLK